jgi:hypothetical protein
MADTDRDADPNWIVQRDDDGNVEFEIDLELCNTVADDMLNDMWELDGELENFDFVAAVFSMFVNSIHILLDHGWSPQDLQREVTDHSQSHMGENDVLH